MHALGSLDLEELRSFADVERGGPQPSDDAAQTLKIDLSAVERIDGAAMALLIAFRVDLEDKGIDVDIVSVPDAVRPIVDLYTAHAAPRRRERRKPEGAVEQVGRETVGLLHELREIIAFLGEMMTASIGVLRRPRSGHLSELPALIERAGADALPIVLLINFLIGFVMAYQSARQLKLYGANLFVADVVGISVTRELAPLMTAIIVCGRSGAAFATEIGSMKVSEEVDALRVLGLRPFGWLVVPRVLALLIAVPALTIIADLVGVAGGLFVGVSSLGLTARAYVTETMGYVKLWDIEHGLIKSVAFGLAIALISCQQGFAASGGASGVGRRTTSTVVATLFALVIIDATFTIAFRAFGRP